MVNFSPISTGAAAGELDGAVRTSTAVRLLWAAALLWLAALCAVLILFDRVGEHSWAVVLVLYAPRHLWILPGLALLPFALRRGRRALLWPLAAATLVWLFPLMGFVLPHQAPHSVGRTIRILSYNTTHGVDGPDSLRALLQETRPDLVLFQWSSHLADTALQGPGFEGWTVHHAAQFTVATRFPIVSIETGGVPSGSGPPCSHAIIDTPIGMLDVYDIRPQSAREEIGGLRHRGLRQRVRDVASGALSGRMGELASFREAQIRSIAAMVANASHPVLIAGDTNLPSGSLLLREYFGRFGDAFAQAGWGFGFTHPAKLPWMRLDRVLLGRELAASSFHVLPRRTSAHRAILVEIGRAG
jgi:vancomycin resistance protein VanJ